MGAKLEEKVLRSIARVPAAQRAVPAELRRGRRGGADQRPRAQVEGVEQITPAGSLRRGRETVGDLDLLVTGPAAAAALDRFVAFPRVQEVLAHGDNKASARVGLEGLQVDVRALPPESFGAAMQYFTGSKDHNVAIRMRAVRMGLKLSEYGLFRIDDDSRVAGATEEGVYEALGHAVDSARAAREHAARSRRRSKVGCPSWSSGAHICAATSTCTPPRPTAAPRSRRWPRRRASAGTSTSRSPTTRRRWRWRTGSTRRAWWRIARRVREIERIGRARAPRLLRHRVRHPARRRDGSRERRAGGARPRDRQRPQPHESRAGRR